MGIRRFAGPIVALLVTGSVALTVQPAVAAESAPAGTIQAAAPELVSAIVTRANIEDLVQRAQAAGDTATVTTLTGALATLGTGPAARDIDLGELFKLAKPLIVAALRYGGPIAGIIVAAIPGLIALIPGTGPAIPILDLILKPIGELLKVGAPALADLLEQVWGKPDRTEVLTSYLRDQAGLPAESATVFGSALGVLSA